MNSSRFQKLLYCSPQKYHNRHVTSVSDGTVRSRVITEYQYFIWHYNKIKIKPTVKVLPREGSMSGKLYSSASSISIDIGKQSEKKYQHDLQIGTFVMQIFITSKQSHQHKLARNSCCSLNLVRGISAWSAASAPPPTGWLLQYTTETVFLLLVDYSTTFLHKY